MTPETPAEIAAEVAADAQKLEALAAATPVCAVPAFFNDFVRAVEDELENAKNALAHLRTSSNATFGGTVVYDCVQLLQAHVTNLDAALRMARNPSGR